jgi:hypothetical protein
MDNPIIYRLCRIAKEDNGKPQLTERERDQLLQMTCRLLKTEDISAFIAREREPFYKRWLRRVEGLLG